MKKTIMIKEIERIKSELKIYRYYSVRTSADVEEIKSDLKMYKFFFWLFIVGIFLINCWSWWNK